MPLNESRPHFRRHGRARVLAKSRSDSTVTQGPGYGCLAAYDVAQAQANLSE